MQNPSYTSQSIRTFIGAKDFSESRRFYRMMGYTEFKIDQKMSLFKVNPDLGFYLQDYYVKDWVNNSMVFVEVENIDSCYEDLLQRNLPKQFQFVRLSSIKKFTWGRECFLHDPSGVLWHFGEFNQ